jgi:hypothetical protein
MDAARPVSIAHMLQTRRIALLSALCALLLALVGGGRVGAAEQAPPEQYWLGPYFGGMRVTYAETAREGRDRFFGYGDCELPEGEGGCSLPVDIQNYSSCDRNPIALDRLPFRVYPLRGGGIAAQYESTAVDVGTGERTVTVYADYELMGAALEELHTESETGPQPLAPPSYPMPVLRELKRATVAARRFDGIGAIARAAELAPEEVRLRLQIAELLGPGALAHVPPPTMSVATVERLRQLAFATQFNLGRAARERGISKAALRRKVDRVRGLTGLC